MGFLEIADHVGLLQWHHRQQRAARRDIGADAQLAAADLAVEGRAEFAVGEVQAGLVASRLHALQVATGLADAGFEDAHLLARGIHCGLALGQPGAGGIDPRLRLLGVLQAAGALAGEGLVAALLVTGEDQLGLLGADLGPRLFDQRLLALQVGLGIGQVGLGTEHVGFGGGQGGAEVAVVEAGEQLAGLDRLVVLDQNVLDEAGDFRRDQGEIGVHIGVVGALHDPWGEQVEQQVDQ